MKRSLQALERFPRLGRELGGRWEPFRLVLGPWRWMLILYVYLEDEDMVLIASSQDALSSAAATSG